MSNQIELKQFQKVRAVFKPEETDDLPAAVKEQIGFEAKWQACWIVEGGEYAGQWAMALIDVDSPFFGWVPLCDLEAVEVIDE